MPTPIVPHRSHGLICASGLLAGFVLITLTERHAGIWPHGVLPQLWLLAGSLACARSLSPNVEGGSFGIAHRWGFIAGVSVLVLAICLWMVSGVDDWQKSGPSFWMPLRQSPFMLLVLAPFAEEYCFRGFLLSMLQRRWGEFRAILSVGLLFALLHLHVDAIVPMLMLSLLAGLAVVRKRQVIAGVAIHSAWNLIALNLTSIQR